MERARLFSEKNKQMEDLISLCVHGDFLVVGTKRGTGTGRFGVTHLAIFIIQTKKNTACENSSPIECTAYRL